MSPSGTFLHYLTFSLSRARSGGWSCKKCTFFKLLHKRAQPIQQFSSNRLAILLKGRDLPRMRIFECGRAPRLDVLFLTDFGRLFQIKTIKKENLLCLLVLPIWYFVLSISAMTESIVSLKKLAQSCHWFLSNTCSVTPSCSGDFCNLHMWLLYEFQWNASQPQTCSRRYFLSGTTWFTTNYAASYSVTYSSPYVYNYVEQPTKTPQSCPSILFHRTFIAHLLRLVILREYKDCM
jgi:hypothetical protein